MPRLANELNSGRPIGRLLILVLLALASLALPCQPLAVAQNRSDGTLGSPALESSSQAKEGAQHKGDVVDASGKKIMPSAVLLVGDSLFFLTPRALFRTEHARVALRQGGQFVAQELPQPATYSGVPRQEFSNFACVSESHSIIVLDKSGDLYQYSPAQQHWRLFRSNLPFLPNQPDPHFIDLCSFGSGVALLDPERNQIWKCSGPRRRLNGFFPDILPWRVKRGDAMLGDAAAIASDGNVYVVRRQGIVTIYGDGNGVRTVQSPPLPFAQPRAFRPSRLATDAGTPLYIVERENNRVTAVDKSNHRVSQFLFPADSDLRGLLPRQDGFWILNRGALEHRCLARPDKAKGPAPARRLDQRLKAMTMPIEGMRLPRHPGVFPGARRLYRYGVHEGLDLFYDAGAITKVKIGTPVVAAERGTVVRADADYKEMSATQFNKVMAECYKQHRTSHHNEDLLRGCQVWIEHGNGLMTRYAHLSKIRAALKPGDLVNAHDLIAYVGISGTGQNLPGRTPFPHLHFEIWLDGRYLGFGLTPTETMQVYEDIFAHK